jgi:hypothetical protein
MRAVPRFTLSATLFLFVCASASAAPSVDSTAPSSLAQDWLARWDKNITSDARNRYCDKETGEELGWLVSPFQNGFYYGYMATGDKKWVSMLFQWSEAVISRGVKEPDGFLGWPKAAGASTSAVEDFYTDNELGEAMMLRPMVLMAGQVLKNHTLDREYAARAVDYIRFSEEAYTKWDSRGAWREIKGGGLWVVPPFGIDEKTGKWTAGYDSRKVEGFSLPANKENAIALWLLSMYDVTLKKTYRDRAEEWFRLMKSRMRTTEDGKYVVWNYWDPAGPWDKKPDGSLKHWVGVHPNGGYYAIDVEAIVAAYEHGIVFTKDDIDRLIATNRDFMWNGEVKGAQFRRIDGGAADPRWAKTPGVLWTALVPYDTTLRQIFEANHDPASWGGLATTPWYLARMHLGPGPGL